MGERPAFVDLFCGCGGASIGYERAGLDAVLALDASETAVAAYNAHSPGAARVADLSKDRPALAGALSVALAARCPRGLALVHASPPCTDFSSAGPRVEGASAELSVAATELALALMPRVFVLENVPRFLASRAFERCRVLAAAVGYNSVAFELDASQYGVPQVRRRAFWVCAQCDVGRLEAVARAVHSAAAARPATVASALSREGMRAPEFFFLPPRGALNRSVHSSAFPAPTLRTNCANAMPAGWARRLVDAADPADAEQLDLAQLAALQALPGAPPAPSRSAAGRMIGNALPPPLTAAIARALLAHGLLSEGRELEAAATIGGTVCFVPAIGAPSHVTSSSSSSSSGTGAPGREALSRRGARRQSHIALFRHAHFAEEPPRARERFRSEDDDDDEDGDGDGDGDAESDDSGGSSDDERGQGQEQEQEQERESDAVECAALVPSRVRGVRRLVISPGACATCDAVAAQISGAPLPPGWRLEIIDRRRTAYRRDDLYWLPPAGPPPASSSSLPSPFSSSRASASASASAKSARVRIRSRAAFLAASAS